MKLTKRILCVVCALAMLLVAIPVAQMMTSAETTKTPFFKFSSTASWYHKAESWVAATGFWGEATSTSLSYGVKDGSVTYTIEAGTYDKWNQINTNWSANLSTATADVYVDVTNNTEKTLKIKFQGMNGYATPADDALPTVAPGATSTIKLGLIEEDPDFGLLIQGDQIACGENLVTLSALYTLGEGTADDTTTTEEPTEEPTDAPSYEREALIKWGATMTHWYSKTEGWLSGAVNDGDLGDNITCSKGTMKVNIADVKAQQANINFSMAADSDDCKELNALIDELIEKDAIIECDVKVVSAKKADGTDYQSIKYKLKTNNGDMSSEDNNYTNVGETRTLRYTIADLVAFTKADVYSAGVMLFGGDWNSGFSELVVEISPIYYLKEVETTTTTTEAPTTTVADVTTTVADVTTTVADVTTTTANVPGVDTPDTPHDVPTTTVGGKYETDVVQDPNAPVATDDSINVFSMEDKTAKAGDTIEVPVVLSNVDKIWGAQLNIAFDTNGLEFVSFAKGDVFVDVLENKNDVADGFISVLLSHNLTDGTDVDNVHEGGVVFTLTFKVLDTAAEGTYGVAFVNYDAESFFEIENDTVDVAFKSAIITVAEEEKTTTSGAEDPTDATVVETPDAPVDTPDDVESNGDVVATTTGADTTDANGNSTAPQTGAAAAPIAAAALAVAAAVVVFKSRKK